MITVCCCSGPPRYRTCCWRTRTTSLSPPPAQTATTRTTPPCAPRNCTTGESGLKLLFNPVLDRAVKKYFVSEISLTFRKIVTSCVSRNLLKKSAIFCEISYFMQTFVFLSLNYVAYVFSKYFFVVHIEFLGENSKFCKSFYSVNLQYFYENQTKFRQILYVAKFKN
jgi:hypothetical protein